VNLQRGPASPTAPLGIDGVRSVRRDGALVTVELRLRPRGARLTPEQARALPVAARLGDLDRTRLTVRDVIAADEMLRVRAEVPLGADGFTLRFDGIIRDTVDVSLQNEDPAFDPAGPPEPAPVREAPVLLDYLAKDFRSFKRLMLDSISHHLPGFTERHEADVGIAIVEVLAYAADQLSYFQDAVATEAYLQTARRRISVRRHARLIGYRLHEGCTPRVWMHVRVRGACELERRFRFSTAAHDTTPPLTFETLEPAHLEPSMNELLPWAAGEDVVPQGSTHAMLVCPGVKHGGPALERFAAGTVLVFERVLDPLTGRRAPPKFRQAVRLSRDGYELPRGTAGGPRLVRIDWHDEDRLAYDFPVRAVAGGRPTTVVRGNIVAADYGTTHPPLDPPPAVDAAWAMRLHVRDLTYAVPFDPRDEPASRFTDLKPYKALPAIAVRATALGDTREWSGRRDLIGLDPYRREFAVEVERDGLVVLRFGDGVNGWRPDAASRFEVTYRSGNGPAGHAGADQITHWQDTDKPIESAYNPLPSAGGIAPLDLVTARREAPEKIRLQKRCVSDQDYVDVAQSVPGVSACVRRRWTGTTSVVEVYVHAKDESDEPAARKARAEVAAEIAQRRPVGVAFEVCPPRLAGIVVKLAVRYGANARASEVVPRVAAEARAELRRRRLGLGKRVFASWFVDAALRVPGVVDVKLATFRRYGGDDARARGFIELAPTEAPVLVDAKGSETGGRPLVEAIRA
jgi:Baseplate J-like protein